MVKISEVRWLADLIHGDTSGLGYGTAIDIARKIQRFYARKRRKV